MNQNEVITVLKNHLTKDQLYALLKILENTINGRLTFFSVVIEWKTVFNTKTDEYDLLMELKEQESSHNHI